MRDKMKEYKERKENELKEMRKNVENKWFVLANIYSDAFTLEEKKEAIRYALSTSLPTKKEYKIALKWLYEQHFANENNK